MKCPECGSETVVDEGVRIWNAIEAEMREKEKEDA